MKYGKLFGIPALLAGVLTACAADYPSENELWKSFNNTPGSYIHVNRVFVNPGKESRKKLSAKDKAYKERNAARMSVRRRTLNRIWSDFSPGEKALILQEKYDLFHGKLYEAVIVTQRAMYLAMINEHPDKGEVFRKCELKPSASAHLVSRANAISAKDGSCELIDTTNYPAFVSVRVRDGKWKTAVYVAINQNWRKVPEKRQEYFQKTSKIMDLLDGIEYVKSTCDVPQVIVKK